MGSREAGDSLGDTPHNPSISVCVVTYERASFLLRCLRSLAGAAARGAQIVIVDASHTSLSEDVRNVAPEAVYRHAPGLAGWMTRARNEALLWATGDVISFLDDDVVVHEGWDAAVIEAFVNPSVAAIVGRTRNGLPGEETYPLPIGRVLDNGSLTEGFAADASEPIEVDHGIGANMSFRRSVLARLGGFRDDYPGTALREDTDIFLRVKAIGGRAIFKSDAWVDHLPAPHVRGARFDTRYKLYGRRNHMVLLARAYGIRSHRVWRWVAGQFGEVQAAPGVRRKLERLGVTMLGVGWGMGAMCVRARWRPLEPERRGVAAERVRTALAGP